MRLTKIIILLFLLTELAFSQNQVDPAKVIDRTSITRMQPSNNQFWLGWNWGSKGKNIDDLLHTNFYHDLNDGVQNLVHSDTKYIAPLRQNFWGGWPVSTGRAHKALFNAQCLHLEPTISVDSTHNFRQRFGDNTGSVFGFQNRNLTVGDTVSSGTNFSRFILNKDSISTETVVLSNIWKKDILYRLTNSQYKKGFTPQEITDRDATKDTNFNGEKIILSINLRNLEQVPSNLMDIPILSIRIPYKEYDVSLPDTGFKPIAYAKFHETSQKTANYLNDTLHIRGSKNDFRGIKRKLVNAAPNSTTIYITGRMLNYFTSNEDMTLNYSILFDDKDGHNPYLKSEWWEHKLNDNHITELDVEVTYYGYVNVAIDWIRLQTPTALDIFEGKHDLLIERLVDTLMTEKVQTRTDINLFRFYGADEPLPALWATERYFNILLDTMVVCETFANESYMPHYNINLSNKEFLNGSNLRKKLPAAVPFLKYAVRGENPHTQRFFGYSFGYGGNDEHQFDSLNSGYETFYKRHNPGFNPGWTYHYLPYQSPSLWHIKYPSTYVRDDSPQTVIERQIYEGYYKNSPFLFDKKWIANLWLCNEGWIGNDTVGKQKLYIAGNANITGEEIRLETHLPLILGTKGFMYFIKPQGGSFNDGFFVGPYNPNATQQPSDTSLIWHKQQIGDFMDFSSTNPNWNAKYVDGYYKLDSMNIPKSRVYIGMMSARYELYKLHKYVKQNEDELMSLRLKSWYGKGFTRMGAQDSTESVNYLSTFIDTTNLRTKKLYQPTPTGYLKQYTLESKDSSFYDITLLKNENISMDTVFYIGIQNRRTDPLVLFEEDTTDRHILFLSSAELDTLCRNGGKNPLRNTLYDPTYADTVWQKYWWKRFGAREFTIPFDFNGLSGDEKDLSLRVTELGVNDTSLTNQWWYADKYRHNIDTSIHGNRSLTVRLLPGEGKILKVQVSRDNKPIFGNLEHSNQRKLIAYPVLDTTNSVFVFNEPNRYGKIDSVRYHITYDRNGIIYYRRSHPMYKDFPTTNINWEDTEYAMRIDTAINMTPFDLYPIQFLQKFRKFDSCTSPTIVVRLDTTDANDWKQIAHIVWDCHYTEPTSDFASKTVIMEQTLRVDRGVDTLTAYAAKLPNVIGAVNSLDTISPTINASYQGNYYAWNDPTNGIVVGFKRVNQGSLQFNKITVKGNDTSGRFYHPSLNTYSRIRLQENDAALVWQEKGANQANTEFDIYYTRVNLNSGGNIQQYIPQTFCGGTSNTSGIQFNEAENSLILNLDSFNLQSSHRLPMVYRGVETNFDRDYNINYDPLIANKNDAIYWEGKAWDSTEVIFYANIDLIDDLDANNNMSPGCMVLRGQSFIKYPGKKLSGVNVAQGTLTPFIEDGVKKYTKGDWSFSEPSIPHRTVVINFSESAVGQEAGATDNIWHLASSYWSLLSNWGIYTTNMNNINNPYFGQLPLNDGGYLSHLAAMPFYNDDQNWTMNRRVFIDSVTPTRRISSSLLFYYPKLSADLIMPVIPMWGFSNGKSSNYFSPIAIGTDNSLILDETNVFDNSSGYQIPKDTIYTNWFKVGDEEEIRYFDIASSSGKASIQIESKDKKFKDYPKTALNNKLGYKKVKLINGGNNEYRLKIIKQGTDANYSEMLLINKPQNQQLFKSMQEDLVIDLGGIKDKKASKNLSLSIFPNPADEKLFVTAYLPLDILEDSYHKQEEISIRLYDILGMEYYSIKAKSGETIEIPVSNYSNGSYLIKAEYETKKINPIVPAFERVIISR